jgi:hypothetical protein
LFLSTALFAQHITNKLGTSGKFYINDKDDYEIIRVDDGGTFHFKNEVPGSSTQFDLYNAGHNLKLNFYKANGTPSAPTAVHQNIYLGSINFWGYSSGYKEGASIIASIPNGASVSGSSMPTQLTFYTRATTTNTVKMKIEPSGRVNITTVLNLNPGTAPSYPEKGDIYYDDADDKVRVYTGSAWEDLN